jgi:hypothetical protein
MATVQEKAGCLADVPVGSQSSHDSCLSCSKTTGEELSAYTAQTRLQEEMLSRATKSSAMKEDQSRMDTYQSTGEGLESL